MATIREISAKVSELRAKIAVFEALSLHVQVQYLSVGDGAMPPDGHFTGVEGRVSEDHINAAMIDMVMLVDGYRTELAELEAYEVDLPTKTPKVAEAPTPEVQETGVKEAKVPEEPVPEKIEEKAVVATPAAPKRKEKTDGDPKAVSGSQSRATP